MATRFVPIDRDTPLLLPPNLRDWVPADHLVHSILDAVDVLDLRQVKVNTRGTGSEQYPPHLLLARLIYSYATGTFGSRRIEQSTHDSVPVRLLTADTHPDHDTLCTFRCENQALLTESFVKVLQLAEPEAKLAERAAQQERGEKAGGKPPQPPTPKPDAKDQYNFTDAESRIMKAGNGNHFEQSYNAQAAVEVASRLIVGQRVSQAPNDKQELEPTLASVPAQAGSLAVALVDSGFFSEKAVRQIEQTASGQATGTTVYAAVEKTGHHRSVSDLEKPPEPAAPAPGASVIEVMRHRLKTRGGKQLYKLRQQTVEPVFGIIKTVLGFRQFRLRGREQVSLEWTLVCLAYNLKRLHRLGAGLKLAATN
jgi:transposase